MPQSFAAAHLHFVFSTKHRHPFLSSAVASRIHEYLGGALLGIGCSPLAIGGMPDHVHLLIGMGRVISIADIVKTTKASSSRWIHDAMPELASFSWQSGYGVFAVSHDRIPAVRGYIERQEDHHRKKTFQEEYREFLSAHGIAWDERYVWD